MDGTMTMDAPTTNRRAPASGDHPRTAVNRIRNSVPELATPVWAKRLTNGLGIFSIGLGLAELAATGPLTRWLGVEDHAALVRAYGVREIATGVNILTASRLAPFLWGRVAGDVLDLASLGAALRDEDSHKREVAVAIGAVLGVMLLDILAGSRMSSTRS
jgi:hypothetical protein